MSTHHFHFHFELQNLPLSFIKFCLNWIDGSSCARNYNQSSSLAGLLCWSRQLKTRWWIFTAWEEFWWVLPDNGVRCAVIDWMKIVRVLPGFGLHVNSHGFDDWAAKMCAESSERALPSRSSLRIRSAITPSSSLVPGDFWLLSTRPGTD